MQCLTPDQCASWRTKNRVSRTWKNQLTCITPLDRLQWFAGALTNQLKPIHHVLLVVDDIVMQVPPPLDALRREAGESRPIHEAPGHLIDGDATQFTYLLATTLSGWIDFHVLLPATQAAIVADHDEYTTIFLKSPAQLAETRKCLQAERVELVDYARPNP